MPPSSPPVELGSLIDGGLAPAILAVVQRGMLLRPQLAVELEGEIELGFAGSHPPVRVRFRGVEGALVEDGPAPDAQLRVDAELGDVAALLVTPLLGGLPSPVDPRGRLVLGKLTGGRLRVSGKLALMRRFLALIRI